MEKETSLLLQSLDHLKDDIRESREDIKHLRDELRDYKKSNDKVVYKNKLRISQILLVGALGGYAGSHVPTAFETKMGAPQPLYHKQEKVIIKHKHKKPNEGG